MHCIKSKGFDAGMVLGQRPRRHNTRLMAQDCGAPTNFAAAEAVASASTRTGEAASKQERGEQCAAAPGPAGPRIINNR